MKITHKCFIENGPAVTFLQAMSFSRMCVPFRNPKPFPCLEELWLTHQMFAEQKSASIKIEGAANKVRMEQPPES